ncbi:MAG: M23 family metallopeptidase [Clostridia bacterium]|nr:M23 family metallopeptidase [Clostridia bacterium]
MMKKMLAVMLALLCLLLGMTAFAQEAEEVITTENGFELTKEYRWFVNQYKTVRGRTVTYYDNVYAYNHGDYVLTPFDANVPDAYFVKDEYGAYAIAPIVLDITDAMRTKLYGADEGETYLYYGQYCERIAGTKGRVGFSGVHEGVDFCYEDGAPLYAILGGEITRAGDSNGTVAVYSAEYDVTVLYLHCEDIEVRRGDVVEAGDMIGKEGNKGSGSPYTHVEMRQGRHTTSNTYRDTKLESLCPYPIMQEALGVAESGRQPVTAAAVMQAQIMREQAEAAAKAEAEAQEEAEKNAELEELDIVDELPGTQAGYGFGEETPAAEATPVPEATLPPAGA